MKRIPIKLLFTLTILTPAIGHSANEPSFDLPISCKIDENCWVVNYVDTDPAKGSAKDLKCGSRTYDEHKGTDFAIRDRAIMARGVNVLAPMDGKVLRFRDGEDDEPKTEEQRKAIDDANKNCGNGILIDHAAAGFQGLQTMYCHLKKGSIKVTNDQVVKAGQAIAQVGLSGDTEFPHLHFGIFWEGGVIDPFTAKLNTEGCGQFKRSMWKEPNKIKYQPISIYHGGLTDQIPDFEAVKAGTANLPNPTKDGKALLLWTGIYGLRQGDEVTMKIAAPYGRPYLERSNIMEKDRARQFYYAGKKIDKDNPLQPGTYTGQVIISRDNQQIAQELYTYTIN